MYSVEVEVDADALCMDESSGSESVPSVHLCGKGRMGEPQSSCTLYLFLQLKHLVGQKQGGVLSSVTGSAN